MRWALLLALAGCATGEWQRDYPHPLGERRSTVLLVRDKLTGAPVAGAVVRRCAEWEISRDGHWAPVREERRTDAFGLVVFPPGDYVDSHFSVHAEGYRPTEEHGGPGVHTEVDLERGGEQCLRLLAPGGRPAAGVRVAYKCGCAHSPDLQAATSDADGLVVLPRIGDGDRTIEDPRFRADYLPRGSPRRFGATTVRLWPGGTIRGRLVGPDGAPPAWACVLCETSARGPRVVADRDGSFTLRGVDLDAGLRIFWDGPLADVDLDAYRPGGPMVIRLGGLPEEPVCRVTVTAPVTGVEVAFDRVADGRRFRESVWGETLLDVPPGDYVVAGGGPWERYAVVEQRVHVAGPTAVELAVREQARLEIACPVAGARCHVLLDDRYAEVDAEEPGWLPADATAWLRVALDGWEEDLPIPPAREGVRHVVVDVPDRKEVVIPGFGEDWGAALLFQAQSEDADERRPATRAVGPAWLWVLAPGRRALVELDLPRHTDRPLVLDDLPFEPLPVRTLELLDAEGRPITEPWLDIEDPSPPGLWLWGDWEDDGEGTFRSALFADGRWVRFGDPNEDCPMRSRRLAGDGPYVLRLGTASVEVLLPELGDEPAYLVLDTEILWSDGSEPCVRRGLDAGPHTLIVGVPGKGARVYRLLLREGEKRQVRFPGVGGSR